MKETTALKRLVTKLAIVCISMFGFGYVLVPLYDVFCDLTGLRFTDDEAQLISKEIVEDTSRWVIVEFDASLNQQMPWQVKPQVSQLKVRPGKVYTTNFLARNETNIRMIGQAVPSVTPYKANKHLIKTKSSRQSHEWSQDPLNPMRRWYNGPPRTLNSCSYLGSLLL